jgi:small subunit ribosomal protein S16
MLKIRLQRTGRKNEPTFRLVLTDSKNSTKSGRFLEVMGNFDSRQGEKAEIKTDRVLHWMSKGAQVSETVHNLLVDRKVITGKKVNALPKKKAPVKEVVAEVAPEPVKQAPSEKVEAPAPDVVAEVSEPVVETPAPVETEATPAPEETPVA